MVGINPFAEKVVAAKNAANAASTAASQAGSKADNAEAAAEAARAAADAAAADNSQVQYTGADGKSVVDESSIRDALAEATRLETEARAAENTATTAHTEANQLENESHGANSKLSYLKSQMQRYEQQQQKEPIVRVLGDGIPIDIEIPPFSDDEFSNFDEEIETVELEDIEPTEVSASQIPFKEMQDQELTFVADKADSIYNENIDTSTITDTERKALYDEALAAVKNETTETGKNFAALAVLSGIDGKTDENGNTISAKDVLKGMIVEINGGNTFETIESEKAAYEARADYASDPKKNPRLDLAANRIVPGEAVTAFDDSATKLSSQEDDANSCGVTVGQREIGAMLAGVSTEGKSQAEIEKEVSENISREFAADFGYDYETMTDSQKRTLSATVTSTVAQFYDDSTMKNSLESNGATDSTKLDNTRMGDHPVGDEWEIVGMMGEVEKIKEKGKQDSGPITLIRENLSGTTTIYQVEDKNKPDAQFAADLAYTSTDGELGVLPDYLTMQNEADNYRRTHPNEKIPAGVYTTAMGVYSGRITEEQAKKYEGAIFKYNTSGSDNEILSRKQGENNANTTSTSVSQGKNPITYLELQNFYGVKGEITKMLREEGIENPTQTQVLDRWKQIAENGNVNRYLR